MAGRLLAVDRIVSCIEVEHDLLRRALVRLQEEIDEQRLDRRRIVADLVVARRLGPAQLQTIERSARMAVRCCWERPIVRWC